MENQEIERRQREKEIEKKGVIQIKGYAKINLALDVLRKLPNGYHEVKMILQQIGVHDVIYLGKTEEVGKFIMQESGERTDAEGIYLTTSWKDLPVDKQNLAYRAAKLMKDTYGIEEDVTIYIEKNIPMGAGLAGGSADAAAVLKGMNQLFQLGVSIEELCQMGTWLGADVPFCIVGGAAYAEGIGERITPIKGLPQSCIILLCKPSFSISTKEIYKKYSARLEEMKEKPHPDIEALKNTLETGMVGNFSGNMINVLEYISMEECPQIQEVKDKMQSHQPDAVLMSGSGPTVFAIFRDGDDATAAYDVLKEKYEETYLTRPQ